MLWHRPILDRAGGLLALARDAAEDAAATKVVRSEGLTVRIVDRPFEQPLGPRSAGQIWSRQVRWARLRRATFALYFIPELLTGGALPLAATIYAAPSLGLDPVAVAAAFVVFWFGCEGLLAKWARWHMTPISPLAWILRDLMLPVLWIFAWLGNGFTWRGHEMSAKNPNENRRESLDVAVAGPGH